MLRHPDEQVLGHGHRLDQHEVLVDHTDAALDRVARRLEVDLLAVDAQPAAIGSIETGDDAHQGGLASAVLADQGMDFAVAGIEGDVLVGDDRSEPLGDIGHLDCDRISRVDSTAAAPSINVGSA